MAKKFFWLKLKDDFFTTKEIKRLRKVAGGDTFVIIYLKMQLLSLQNKGTLYFENYEDTFAKELALDLDEDIDNVEVTFQYLLQHGLIEVINDAEYLLPQTVNSIASESDSAERVRKLRNKERALQCNTELQDKDQKSLHSNTNVTDSEAMIITQITSNIEETLQCNSPVTKSNTYTEIDKEKDIDLKTDIDTDMNVNFKKFWDKYPRKIEKGLAYKNWVKCIEDGYIAKDLIQSAINYALEKQDVSMRYLKHPGNFLGEDGTFKSYLPSSYSPPIKVNKGTKTTSNSFNDFPQREYSKEDYENLEKHLINKEFTKNKTTRRKYNDKQKV